MDVITETPLTNLFPYEIVRDSDCFARKWFDLDPFWQFDHEKKISSFNPQENLNYLGGDRQGWSCNWHHMLSKLEVISMYTLPKTNSSNLPSPGPKRQRS